MSLFDDEAHCKDGDSEYESHGTNEYDMDDSFLASENSEDSISSHSVEVEIKKKRGRPPSAAARPNIAARKAEFTEKPVGHLSYPTNDFSLTITKKGGDVAHNSLDLVFKFIEEYCIKGVIAFEVGKRAFNLHIQGLFRLHYPKTKGKIVNVNIKIYVYPTKQILYKM